MERTAAGQAVFGPELAGLVLGRVPAPRAGGPPDPGGGPAITPRETEVLRLVAKGLTAKRIAERLDLSHRTVENHVQNVLRKLALTNRVELARYAIEQGLDSDS